MFGNEEMVALSSWCTHQFLFLNTPKFFFIIGAHVKQLGLPYLMENIGSVRELVLKIIFYSP